jgi:hypothetical protein
MKPVTRRESMRKGGPCQVTIQMGICKRNDLHPDIRMPSGATTKIRTKRRVSILPYYET